MTPGPRRGAEEVLVRSFTEGLSASRLGLDSAIFRPALNYVARIDLEFLIFRLLSLSFRYMLLEYLCGVLTICLTAHDEL